MMKALKKYLGIVWIILGPVAMLLLTWQAWEKINLAKAGIETTNTALQWGIILLIFIPIAIGLVIFGQYALAEEYDKLPEKSENI
jgi:ABC-type polysaccharide/polyol phosphate export permease